MEKITLYKFFAGEASENDKARIKAWLEEDDAHRQQLLDERAYFDAVLLADDAVLENDRRHSLSYRLIHEGWRVGRWAAVLVLAFVGSYWLLEHQYRTLDKALNVVSVPPGQRTELLLADGTKVYLNAGSTLSYPSIFGDEGRQVELDGEAYFEVTKDESKPFVVHTQMCDVEVLGTKFNVEAYSELNSFSAALMEGRVKVDNNYRSSDVVYLSPNQKVRLKGGELAVDAIEDYDVYRWREGLICFTNENFVDLMKRIEKYYGVKLVVENQELAKHSFSGKFRISDGVRNLLRVLRRDVRFEYELSKDGDTIYIR